MIRKKICLIFWILINCLVPLSQAQVNWKSEVNQLLKQKDYRQALHFLEETIQNLENADLQEARALLSFIYYKNNLPEEEKRAIIDYFEEYGQADTVFAFLDYSVFSEVLEFWGKWRSDYPLLSNLNFLVPAGAEDRTIPEVLRLGFELSSEAYYKIQLEGNPLEGGLWTRGPHLVQIPLPFYFDRSYSLNLDIFLKTKSITIRKRIILDFKVENKNLPNQELLVQRQEAPPIKNVEGELALFIGDTLIFKATKYLQRQIPVKITIPPPNPPGTKPYLAPQKNQWPSQGVSILEAISALTSVIKEFKKKPPEKIPATFVKKSEINFVFINPERQEARTEVSLKLRTEKAEPLSY